MGRRAEEPLEKRKLMLFAGDWDRLEQILAPRKIRVSVFIRKLIRQKLREVESRAAYAAKPLPELTDDDLAEFADAAGESTEGSDSDEPE